MAKVYLSIGSNIEREVQIVLAVSALQAEFGMVELSSVYECEPVGFTGHNFYNLVAKIETNQSPKAIADLLKQLEKQHGRSDFTKKFSPRKMDLDILLYDDIILDVPQIPRDEIPVNAYVLKPLAELAPTSLHPELRITYQQMWYDYDKSKQNVSKIDFKWPEHISLANNKYNQG